MKLLDKIYNRKTASKGAKINGVKPFIMKVEGKWDVVYDGGLKYKSFETQGQAQKFLVSLKK